MKDIMKNKTVIWAVICAAVATVLSLTSHIYIIESTKPIINLMVESITTHYDSSEYPLFIMVSAYVTDFFTTGILVFLYYHTQHLIPCTKKWQKLLFVIAIIFGIKFGGLVRQPIMDYLLSSISGMESPSLFIFYTTIDGWVSNLLLAICIVYLCPQKAVVGKKF